MSLRDRSREADSSLIAMMQWTFVVCLTINGREQTRSGSLCEDENGNYVELSHRKPPAGPQMSAAISRLSLNTGCHFALMGSPDLYPSTVSSAAGATFRCEVIIGADAEEGGAEAVGGQFTQDLFFTCFSSLLGQCSGTLLSRDH